MLARLSHDPRRVTLRPLTIHVGTAPDSWGVWHASDPRQTPWQRFLDEVAEAGYDAIELGPFGYLPTEPQRVAAIQKAMQNQKLVIADGHHRYETALNYRNERRVALGLRANAGKIDSEAPYERVMMTFINTKSEGLTILPTHRLAANVHDFSWSGVRRHLEPWFTAEEFPFSGSAERSEVKKKFLAKLTEARAKRAIGVYPSGLPKRAFYVLTLREGANLTQLLPSVSPLQRELDVVLLHEGILEPALGITPQAVTAEANLTYEREALAALDAVDSGRAQISFLLNPCDVDQVMKIATSGEVMPQKSTDFFPKLMSGITMYRIEA